MARLTQDQKLRKREQPKENKLKVYIDILKFAEGSILVIMLTNICHMEVSRTFQISHAD